MRTEDHPSLESHGEDPQNVCKWGWSDVRVHKWTAKAVLLKVALRTPAPSTEGGLGFRLHPLKLNLGQKQDSFTFRKKPQRFLHTAPSTQ